ncbi:hypothetical protein B9Z55_012410 [Caenorhabditis nigoni]|uniref:Uncharacterized protein n=1 Tax=Caenorhabditis nigoni TaxID=1611254 RepID=A0A2G5TX39_9PELO|nr:hypothetical protein B9Z55_012410 [Caenorhabditis nigoni]
MIAVILFQISFLTLTLFPIFLCGGKKKNYDGEGDVSLVQPGVQKINTTPSGGGFLATASSSASKPLNDDFSVGVPPPHIPLADKSDERTLADIESIQSEKAMIREKKSKQAAAAAAANPTATSKSKRPNGSHSPAHTTSAEGATKQVKVSMKGSRSPAQ